MQYLCLGANAEWLLTAKTCFLTVVVNIVFLVVYLLGLFVLFSGKFNKNPLKIIYKDMAVWQEWFSKNLCADFENLIATSSIWV